MKRLRNEKLIQLIVKLTVLCFKLGSENIVFNLNSLNSVEVSVERTNGKYDHMYIQYTHKTTSLW